MPPIPPIPQSDAELHVANSLLPAILLAFTGGGLDAFVYLNHGHVFAAAMTGNGVFLGITLLNHQGEQALRHALAIGSFIVGILAAKLLQSRLRRHAVAVGLAGEMLILFVLAWTPGSFPDLAFVPIIAVASAYQSGSFREVDGYPYNSNFITSNLRTIVDGLYEMTSPPTREGGRRKARSFALIVASFLTGALLGALISPRLLNHTLLVFELPLLAVLALVLRRAA